VARLTDADIVVAPKVELHLHLEGSMRPATVREFAAESGVVLPAALTGNSGAWRFTDFGDFLAQYAVACSTLTTPEHFHRIALELVEDLARQHVGYAEVTFTPTGHARRLGSWTWPLHAVLSGLHEGRRSHGVVVGMILDHSREHPLDVAMEAAKVAVAHAPCGVVALGLGGDEAFPPEPFAAAFELARCGGVPAVVHAGESAGPSSVIGALDALRAVRIGHGIRSLESPELVRRLADEGVPLEVCPTSNVRTGVVGQIEDHPWPSLVDAGLEVTVNSDDPTMFGSDLVGEIRVLRDVFGLDRDDLAVLTRRALAHSFAPDDVRARIEGELADWLAAPMSAEPTGPDS
jgi:adenosine deaminase